MSDHFNNPIDPLIPKEYQERQRQEHADERHRLALAAAKSAGENDARGHLELAEGDWRDVEDLVGLPVPQEYLRARKAACEAMETL